MTDSTKLMSEALNELMEYSYRYGKGEIPTSENPPLLIARKVQDKILAWHDEQKKLYADAMIDRLERSLKGNAQSQSLAVRDFIGSERQRNGGK